MCFEKFSLKLKNKVCFTFIYSTSYLKEIKNKTKIRMQIKPKNCYIYFKHKMTIYPFNLMTNITLGSAGTKKFPVFLASLFSLINLKLLARAFSWYFWALDLHCSLLAFKSVFLWALNFFNSSAAFSSLFTLALNDSGT